MNAATPSLWRGLFLVLLAALALAPVYAQWASEPFIVTFLTRALVFSLAALSLNLILGFAGLVSFGHAFTWGWAPMGWVCWRTTGWTTAGFNCW